MRKGQKMSDVGKARIRAGLLRRKATLGYLLSPETRAKLSKSLTGRKCKPFTALHRKHMSQSMRGKNKPVGYGAHMTGPKHWFWKEKPGKHSMIRWVEGKLGKPSVCEDCGNSSTKKYSMRWVSISREYKRDLSDWKRLCLSCHYRYYARNITKSKVDY